MCVEKLYKETSYIWAVSHILNNLELLLQDVAALTTGHGAPIADKLNSMSIGPRGPLLIQDHAFLEEMAHFDRWGQRGAISQIVLQYYLMGLKNFLQGTDPREGGSCKRRRSFRLLWSNFFVSFSEVKTVFYNTFCPGYSWHIQILQSSCLQQGEKRKHDHWS